MRKCLWCFVVISSVANIGNGYAQVKNTRPTIGIALSGGGARGIAHVGVLRTLEELRVPVDYIAGASMGAVIGGLYASGMSPDEIQLALENLDLEYVLSDKPPREALGFRRREDGRRYLFEIEMGITNDGVQLPGGLITGQVLGLLLRKHTLHVAGIDDFNDLPIPFLAVATDIERGEEVILDRGDLADAMRASMSVPVMFSPVEIDGRKLVDGGMTNNLPVDLVRAMGADVVIAVDASVPLLTREELNTLFDISEQTMIMLARTKLDDQLARADVPLVPDLNGFSFSDYELVEQISSMGAAVVQRKASELKLYSLLPSEYQAYREKRRTKPAPPKKIDALTIQAPPWVDKRLILDRVRTHSGDMLIPAHLERDVADVYAIGEFERVDYTVDVANSEYRATIRANEKPWGPNYLRFGLRFVTDSGGADFRTGIVTFTAVANFTRTRLNARGAEWRNDVRFGQTVGLLSEIYQPIDFSGRWFVASSGFLRKTQQPVFDNGQLVAEYGVDRRVIGVDAGRQFGRFGELRLGLHGGRISAHVDTGSADLPTVETNHVAISSRFVIDRLDNINFPHQGTFVATELVVSREELGSDESYERFSLDAKGFLTKGRHTGFLTVTGGTSFDGDQPAFDDFLLGGFLSLTGFGEDELRGSHFGVARLGYYYRFARLPPASRGLYLGGWAEMGKVWENRGFTELEDSVLTGTVVVGADTGLGPLFVGYGGAESGHDRVYLSLGSTF